MSLISRWYYANTATIRPFVGIDMLSGVTTYGPEYEIACGWIAESKQERDNRGAEFVSRHIVYTEDARPQYLDMVQLGGMGEWEQIRAKTSWEMAAFSDTPDYRLVT